MNIVSKVNAFVGKIAGENAVHVVDGLIGYELAGAGIAIKSQSARDYAMHHPGVSVALALGAPAIAALAAKFRKAATAKPSGQPAAAAGQPEKS